MDLGNLADIAIGLTGGSVSVMAVARWYLGRVFARLDRVEGELASLKAQRVGALETRMDAFEAGCEKRHDRIAEALARVEHMAADLGNILGWTKKIDGKLDRLAEDVAGQRADLASKRDWLQNLDNAHQRHVSDREVHHG